MNVIKKAAELGEVTVGILCDECVAIYEKYPIIPLVERMKIISAIKGVEHVVEQKSIYYDDNLLELRPDYVIHGDNWNKGYQAEVKASLITIRRIWSCSINP